MPVLIVNPRQALETKSVFAQMKIAVGAETHYGAHPQIASGEARDPLIAALKKGRNDMEDAACVLAPIIGDVLAILSAAPGCRLARMSGSGATCFALFPDCRAVAKAQARDRRGASRLVGESRDAELRAERAQFSELIVPKIPRACPQLSQMTAAAKWMAARKFLAVLS